MRLFPESREIIATDSYVKKVLVSIEYYQKRGGKIENLYKTKEELDDLFALDMKISDRNILIEKTKYKINPDEVGSTLSFLVYLRYSDKINKHEKEYETAENVEIEYTKE